MPNPATQPIEILETVYGGPGKSPRIDEENGILYDVKFLGERSGNKPPHNNVYPKAMREQSLAMLEGARINIDHPPRKRGERPKPGETRPYGDGAGVARNLREGGDGTYGEAHFNPKHAAWPQIVWDAKNCPEHLGFSIHAMGNSRRGRNGDNIVEALTEAFSIDLVSRPATTRGLFESLEPDPMPKTTIREVLKRSLTGKALTILEQETPEEMVAPEMAEPAPEATSEENVKNAFREMVMAAFDDESLDAAATLAKIKEILKAQEKLMGGAPADPAADPAATPADPAQPEGPKPDEATESLRREVDSLRRSNQARELCDAEGVVPNRVLKKALEGAANESEMRTLIREHKQASPAPAKSGGARSAGQPIRESRDGSEVSDQKSFAKAVFKSR